MTMFVARFKDSGRAIARRKTEQAAWQAAKLHEIPDDMIEVVSEKQHKQEQEETNE
jgi:hypothetical protein